VAAGNDTRGKDISTYNTAITNWESSGFSTFSGLDPTKFTVTGPNSLSLNGIANVRFRCCCDANSLTAHMHENLGWGLHAPFAGLHVYPYAGG
jgi:hypothetical protein